MRGQQILYVAQIADAQTVTSAAEESHSTAEASGFTIEQVKCILSLNETSKSSHKKPSGKEIWLLNSATSCYMTGTSYVLCDAHDVGSILVELHNGIMTMAIKRGSMALNPKLALNHVLYVPRLNYSLIFMAQLIDEKFCDVTFTKKFYVIQDLTTRSPIGVDEPRRGSIEEFYFGKDSSEQGGFL